jgi:hypothetical protein
MPCDSIYQTPVTFTKIAHKVEHLDLLEAALKELGLQVMKKSGGFRLVNPRFSGRESSATYIDGVFNVPERWQLDINRVKQTYAGQVVMAQAKRFGWLLKRTSATEFEVTRRR